MLGFTDQHRKAYRVKLEEAGLRADPYAWIIPGSRGHIYVHGPDTFGVATIGRRPKLRSMPWLTVTQDGDDGFNATFPVERLKAVARLIGAYRRRKLSEAHRRILETHGVHHRFRKQGTHPMADSTPKHQLGELSDS